MKHMMTNEKQVLHLSSYGIGLVFFAMISSFSASGFAQCKMMVRGQPVEGKTCETHKKQASAIKQKCKNYETNVIPKLNFRPKPESSNLNYSMLTLPTSAEASWLTAAKTINELVSVEMLKTLKQCSDYGLVNSFAYDKAANPFKSMKTQWVDVVNAAVKGESNTMYLLKQAKKRNDPIGVVKSLRLESGNLQAILKWNQILTHFKQNDQALKKRHDMLVSEHKSAIATAEKKLLKTKCPKNKNKRLSKKIKSVVVSHFANGKKPKDVRKVVVVGKPKTKRIRHRRQTHEDVPGYACFKAKTDDNWCGWFSITVRRTKFDGKKWGKYKQVFVGDVKQMSCKNLK